MKTALVVGGTGPTGPLVVEGLQERGFDATLFHRGNHEVDFANPVEHVHGDPHFPETIADALGDRVFDVVVAQYGRLVHLARHFRGRTDHFVGIGGASRLLANATDPAWGTLGRPAVIEEDQHILESDPARDKFGFRMAEAYRCLMECHEDGGFHATYLGYPNLYGPRQLASRDWSIVRRLLDGRRRILLPDGGLKLDTRGYTENVAHAPLLAVDQPEVSAGKSYVVADLEVHSLRQRTEFLAAYLGKEIEIVDVPYALARPCYPLYRYTRTHNISTCRRIREELGYTDAFTAAEGLSRTVDWLLAHPPEPAGESEQLLGDPFDYEREDRIIDAWSAAMACLPEFEYPLPREGRHPYPHPKEAAAQSSMGTREPLAR